MKPETKSVFIAVFGAGTVGTCFLKQLQYLSTKSSLPQLKLCYLAIIDKVLYYPGYTTIDIDNALALLELEGQEPLEIQQTMDYLAAAPGKVVIVDNTSSQALANSYPSFLTQGFNIITPNKKAFSSSLQLWHDIQKAAESTGAMIYHESSVGAGMPVISTLKDLVETGDEVTRIEGVFSGTLSYLMNSFAPANGKGGQWSAVVQRAKLLGYTEPDPRDDLNGLDVARKLTILGRLAGLEIEGPTSFPVESIIPKQLEDIDSVDEFMKRLPDFDASMEKHRTAAENAGKVLRYVGYVDMVKKEAKVGLEVLDPFHPISLLKGSDNIISFYTKRYNMLPLTIRGAGAGGDVTAMGISSDLLKVLSQI